MSDILRKRATMQAASSSRDVNQYGIGMSQPSTPVNREHIDERSAADSDTFHTASDRTFEIATEKGGRKPMSEDEVNSLVHNALRRARQATKTVSPRHRARVNPLSPRVTTSTPSIASPRPPSSDPKYMGNSRGGTASQFSRPGSSSDSGEPYFYTTAVESNMSNISCDGSDFQQAFGDDASSSPSEGDSGSEHLMIKTVSSSEAIIRRVEEEIANARKAAQEANRRLAGVSANLRFDLSEPFGKMMTKVVEAQGQPPEIYDLPNDPLDEIKLSVKPQPSVGSAGASVRRNDSDLVDSSMYEVAAEIDGSDRFNSFESQGTSDHSAETAGLPNLDNQVSILTEDSVDLAEALLDQALYGPTTSTIKSHASDEMDLKASSNDYETDKSTIKSPTSDEIELKASSNDCETDKSTIQSHISDEMGLKASSEDDETDKSTTKTQISDEMGLKASSNDDESDKISTNEENRNEPSEVELLHLESESIIDGDERHLNTPTNGRSADESTQEAQCQFNMNNAAAAQSIQSENGKILKPCTPKSHLEFPSHLSAEGNIIMRILAQTEQRQRSFEMAETTDHEFVEGEGSCHEVIDLTRVESEGTSGAGNSLAQEPESSEESTGSVIGYNASSESSNAANLEYDAPTASIETNYSHGIETKLDENAFRLHTPVLSVEPELPALGDFTPSSFDDCIKERETNELAGEYGTTLLLPNNVQEKNEARPTIESSKKNVDICDYKQRYPVLPVEAKRAVGGYDSTSGSIKEFTDVKENLEDSAVPSTKDANSADYKQRYPVLPVEAKPAVGDDQCTSGSNEHSTEYSIQMENQTEPAISSSIEKVDSYPDLAVEPKRVIGDCSQGISRSFEDRIEGEEIIEENDNIEVIPEYHSSVSFEKNNEEENDCARTHETPESHDNHNPEFSDSFESDDQHLVGFGKGTSYEEPIKLTIHGNCNGEMVVPSKSVEGDHEELIREDCFHNEENTIFGSASTTVDLTEEDNNGTSTFVKELTRYRDSAQVSQIAADLSPVKDCATVPIMKSIDDTGVITKPDVHESESIEAQPSEDIVQSKPPTTDFPVEEKTITDGIEESVSDAITEIVANSSFTRSETGVNSEAESATVDNRMVKTAENVDDQREPDKNTETAPEESSCDETFWSSLEEKLEEDLVTEERSKKDVDVPTSEEPTAAAPNQPGTIKNSRSNKVRFKQRYPVPPANKKQRSAEEIIKEHRVVPSGNALFLSMPKADLRELLQAAVGSSLQRRSNACGALKVLTTQKKNQLTLVRTAGVLDSLVFATNDKISSNDMDFALDARTRAVLAICNLSAPRDNREIIMNHTGLVMSLIKTIVEDKSEARTAACGCVAFLAKTPSNREALAQTKNLVTALAIILKGGKTNFGFEDETEPTFSDDSFQQSYTSGSESSSVSSSIENDSSLSNDAEEDIPVPRVRSIREEKKGQAGEMTRRGQINACAALLHISKQCGATPLMCSNVELMDALVEVSHREDDPKHIKCLEILCNLSRFPPNNESMAKFPGLVDTLVFNAGSSYDVDRVWSLRTLQNISTVVAGKTVLANRTVLELLSYSIMRDILEEQTAATATIYNLSTEPGAVVPLTNTKNVVATLVHVAHNPDSSSEVRHMACDALATLGLWMQTLAGAGTVPKNVNENVTLPSYITSGWKRWD